MNRTGGSHDPEVVRLTAADAALERQIATTTAALAVTSEEKVARGLARQQAELVGQRSPDVVCWLEWCHGLRSPETP